MKVVGVVLTVAKIGLTIWAGIKLKNMLEETMKNVFGIDYDQVVKDEQREKENEIDMRKGEYQIV